MTETRIEEKSYGSWGNTVELKHGDLELVASLEFGPRILRLGYAGETNLFMEDTERKIVQKGEHFAPVGGGEWRIYGGHRLWTSPETSPRTTYPDNETVKWERTERGVRLVPPPEKWTQMQKEVEIRFEADRRITVRHAVTNQGAWPVEFAPWALSVMAPGGVGITPLPVKDTGLLPNTVLSLWPYSRMNDPRVTWGEKFVILRQDAGPTPFKFGVNNEQGYAAYWLNGTLFVKTYQPDPQGSYPDFGVSFESYVCDDFLEVETLGQLKTVHPGETAVHTEQWRVFKDVALPLENEGELEQALEQLLGS